MSLSRIAFGLGLALLVFGTILLFTAAQNRTLICSKGAEPAIVNCRVIVYWLEVWQIREERVAQIETAVVNENCDRDDLCSYRVDLLSEEGERLSLTNYHSLGRDDKQQTVDRINAYLTDINTREPLRIQSGATLLGSLLTAVFFVAGLGLMSVSRRLP